MSDDPRLFDDEPGSDGGNAHRDEHCPVDPDQFPHQADREVARVVELPTVAPFRIHMYLRRTDGAA